MIKSLSAKLSAVLLGLLCLIGGLYIWLTLFSTQLYQQEVTQQLNRNLAQHLVSEEILMEGGQVNRETVEKLFHMLMVINPNIEIYLLDPGGMVLACSAPPERIERKLVDLRPVQSFLAGRERMPILGDDPQDIKRQKVFSAAVIPLGDDNQHILSSAFGTSGTSTSTTGTSSTPANNNAPIAGYLYVVLGGKAYDSAAEMFQGSYIVRLSTWMVLASVLLTLLAGLLLFRLLTRRLTRLTKLMESFTYDDDVVPTPVLALIRIKRGGDEIDRLGATFNKMSERILQQMQGLKQTDLLRRELVVNVSHDLRTPLASLQGYLETLLLKEGELSDAEQQHYLEIALSHSERLSRLVGELFELAKLDAQAAPPQLEAFSLGELAHDVVQELQLAAEKKGVSLQTDIPQDLLFVYADIGLIERVLGNLIDNALRYTTACGKVMVSITRYQKTIRAEVRDTGCGIPAQDLPHIFDRFYRVEKARAGDAGAGLGLAIAQRILELHQSTLHVESTLEVGTGFTFYLPIWET